MQPSPGTAQDFDAYALHGPADVYFYPASGSSIDTAAGPGKYAARCMLILVCRSLLLAIDVVQVVRPSAMQLLLSSYAQAPLCA